MGKLVRPGEKREAIHHKIDGHEQQNRPELRQGDMPEMIPTTASRQSGRLIVDPRDTLHPGENEKRHETGPAPHRLQHQSGKDEILILQPTDRRLAKRSSKATSASLRKNFNPNTRTIQGSNGSLICSASLSQTSSSSFAARDRKQPP